VLGTRALTSSGNLNCRLPILYLSPWSSAFFFFVFVLLNLLLISAAGRMMSHRETRLNSELTAKTHLGLISQKTSLRAWNLLKQTVFFFILPRDQRKNMSVTFVFISALFLLESVTARTNVITPMVYCRLTLSPKPHRDQINLVNSSGLINFHNKLLILL